MGELIPSDYLMKEVNGVVGSESIYPYAPQKLD